MTVADFVHEGNYIDYTPSAKVDAGDVVVRGYIVGIAKVDIPANTLGALAITGVYGVPKQGGAGVAFADGALVYWDVANERATATTSHVLMGHAVGAAADAATSVRVRLMQSLITTTTTTTTTAGP